MDPRTTTREQFTQSLISPTLPTTSEGAKQEWIDQANKLRTLLDKLAHHPAMGPNLNQTYMTPAASKNKVYFMWDFVGRTLGMLYAVPPGIPGPARPQFQEVIERSMNAGMLIQNQPPGMLDMMMQTANPEAGQVEFGDEILRLAREL